MMAAIFAALFLAMLVAWIGSRAIAVGLAIVGLALTVWLFLFEIYSPETGFRMPWLQTSIETPVPAPPQGAA